MPRRGRRVRGLEVEAFALVGERERPVCDPAWVERLPRGDLCLR